MQFNEYIIINQPIISSLIPYIYIYIYTYKMNSIIVRSVELAFQVMITHYQATIDNNVIAREKVHVCMCGDIIVNNSNQLQIPLN